MAGLMNKASSSKNMAKLSVDFDPKTCDLTIKTNLNVKGSQTKDGNTKLCSVPWGSFLEPTKGIHADEELKFQFYVSKAGFNG